MSKKSQKLANEFRIIGGQWRSRRLSLQPAAQLRPTPDRVRETLFNWLGHDIIKARCLDLFSGSGALGFEALSRGAAYCDFVELDKAAARQIKRNLDLLNVPPERATIYSQSAESFIHAGDFEQYDIIFLDPPFGRNMIPALISDLHELVHTGGLLYIEIEKSSALSDLPDNWTVIREKTAGQVRYHLVQVE